MVGAKLMLLLCGRNFYARPLPWGRHGTARQQAPSEGDRSAITRVEVQSRDHLPGGPGPQGRRPQDLHWQVGAGGERRDCRGARGDPRGDGREPTRFLQTFRAGGEAQDTEAAGLISLWNRSVSCRYTASCSPHIGVILVSTFT